MKASASAWSRSIFLGRTAPEIGPVFVRRSTATSPIQPHPPLLPVTLVTAKVPTTERPVCDAVRGTPLTFCLVRDVMSSCLYPKFEGSELEPFLLFIIITGVIIIVVIFWFLAFYEEVERLICAFSEEEGVCFYLSMFEELCGFGFPSLNDRCVSCLNLNFLFVPGCTYLLCNHF